MSEAATVIRSPQEFLEAFKSLAVKPPAAVAQPAQPAQPEPSFAPLTLEQVNAKIEEFSAALDSPLPEPVRVEMERRRAALVREQMRLRVGYIPDADGNNPAEAKAIAETVTAKVVDALAAAPQSTQLQAELDPNDEEEEPTEDELDEAMNDFDAFDSFDALDAAVVSTESPVTISAPVEAVPAQRSDGAVLISAEVASALRASLVANMPHITAKILGLVLGK